MQDLIQKLVGDHAAQWRTQLQVHRRLRPGPVAELVQGRMESAIGAFSSGQLDLGEITGGLDASRLLEKIDLGQIAVKAGVDAARAREGAEALAPELASALGEAAGGDDRVQRLMGKAEELLGGAGDPVAKLFGE